MQYTTNLNYSENISVLSEETWATIEMPSRNILFIVNKKTGVRNLSLMHYLHEVCYGLNCFVIELFSLEELTKTLV